ncbi:MAG: hypothetical protein Kow0047_14860 [Anaerolineae bacterium]
MHFVQGSIPPMMASAINLMRPGGTSHAEAGAEAFWDALTHVLDLAGRSGGWPLSTEPGNGDVPDATKDIPKMDNGSAQSMEEVPGEETEDRKGSDAVLVEGDRRKQPGLGRQKQGAAWTDVQTLLGVQIPLEAALGWVAILTHRVGQHLVEKSSGQAIDDAMSVAAVAQSTPVPAMIAAQGDPAVASAVELSRPDVIQGTRLEAPATAPGQFVTSSAGAAMLASSADGMSATALTRQVGQAGVTPSTAEIASGGRAVPEPMDGSIVPPAVGGGEPSREAPLEGAAAFAAMSSKAGLGHGAAATWISATLSQGARPASVERGMTIVAQSHSAEGDAANQMPDATSVPSGRAQVQPAGPNLDAVLDTSVVSVQPESQPRHGMATSVDGLEALTRRPVQGQRVPVDATAAGDTIRLTNSAGAQRQTSVRVADQRQVDSANYALPRAGRGEHLLRDLTVPEALSLTALAHQRRAGDRSQAGAWEELSLRSQTVQPSGAERGGYPAPADDTTPIAAAPAGMSPGLNSAETVAVSAPVDAHPSSLGERVAAIQELIDRIQWAVGKNVQECRLHLHPRELGRVDVKLTTNQDRLLLVMKVETADAHTLIQGNLDHLRQSLAERGIRLERCDIVYSAGGDLAGATSGWGGGPGGHAKAWHEPAPPAWLYDTAFMAERNRPAAAPSAWRRHPTSLLDVEA